MIRVPNLRSISENSRSYPTKWYRPWTLRRMSSDDFCRMPSFRWMPLWCQVKSPSLATSERCGHHKVLRFQHQAFRGQVALGSWWQVTNKESEFWMLWNLSVFDCHAPVRHSFLPCCTYSTFWPWPIYFDISFVILRILKESFPFQVSITVLLNMKAVELSSRGAPVGAETSTWQPTQTPKRLWSLAALISCTFHNAVQ